MIARLLPAAQHTSVRSGHGRCANHHAHWNIPLQSLQASKRAEQYAAYQGPSHVLTVPDTYSLTPVYPPLFRNQEDTALQIHTRHPHSQSTICCHIMADVRFAVGIQRLIRMTSRFPPCSLAYADIAFLGYHHVLMMILAASWVLSGE